MSKKKILFFGGAFSQIPAIKYAKEQGYYVITADYLPQNPGHKFSDEYYNVSTTNKEEILALARKLKIDAISAYASDPAAPTAAYVSERMNLVGSPYKAVEILSNKCLFRNFLKRNGFYTPWFHSGNDLSELVKSYNGEKAILKPVDSSGSKGIFLIKNSDDLNNYFEAAKRFSKSGEVILEQFIERKGPQIHGEGYVLNGNVVFILMGDQVFSPVNNLIPYSTMVPSFYHVDVMNEAINLVREAIRLAGYRTGGINVELIRDIYDDIYILEIGARNGGNFMPQLIKHTAGFDLVKANIDSLFGKDISYTPISNPTPYAQIILHATSDGSFKGLNIPEVFNDKVVEKIIYYSYGDILKKYESSRDVVGVIIIDLSNELNSYHSSVKENNWIIVA